MRQKATRVKNGVHASKTRGDSMPVRTRSHTSEATILSATHAPTAQMASGLPGEFADAVGMEGIERTAAAADHPPTS